tara:strand:- start:26404 stop:28308 length:1905 start_codon:yes stop_codon:yes gene_type:complete
MKIPYKHLVKDINSNPSIEELSDRLFQLGHEHEISDEIFDMDLTPNRGDCLSLRGLLRDLRTFYDISLDKDIYKNDISNFSLEFLNDSKNTCKVISFLKIEIDKIPEKYKGCLEDYFLDLDIKKNNFFTDVSNYISYETGQPTHCYRLSSINQPIKLNFLKESCEFKTLLDKKIPLDEGDLVFCDKNNEVINLAGVIGGKSTACDKNTKSVILECAHFDQEAIIGKSLKYDINSDAAHKFERNTDPLCHDYVLRRFLSIIKNHAKITNVEIFTENSLENENKSIKYEVDTVNKILGINISEFECSKYLKKLGFNIEDNIIEVPSYRNDIDNMNDISEEVARCIGYDNIEARPIKIKFINDSKQDFKENKIKKILIDEGFYEVINNPFVGENNKESVLIDNPLDSNRKYLRTNLKDSLIKNLLFNERRQKDSIKLFELSDIYSNKNRMGNRVIGIIASGRVDKNYLDFSKKIDKNYFENILSKIENNKFTVEEISRQNLDSKLKDSIMYCEIEIDSCIEVDGIFDNVNLKDISNKKYIPVSEFPSSYRDLSFSIKDFAKCRILEEFILNFKNNLLKEVFVFDYFKNEKMREIKIGFRFIFQSKSSTITDKEVDEVMNLIIKDALKLESISIPGLH